MEIACDATIGVCAALILLNWASLLAAIRAHRNYSFAPPFVCGIVAAVAIALHPHPGLLAFAFIPIVLDPSILAALFVLLRRREKR